MSVVVRAGCAVIPPPICVLYSYETHWNRVGVRVRGSADAVCDATAESDHWYAQHRERQRQRFQAGMDGGRSGSHRTGVPSTRGQPNC